MLFLASKRDFTQVSGPKLCAHNAIRIHLLDYVNYFVAHKMKYPFLFEIITDKELIKTGLVGSYSGAKIFIDFTNIPDGKIQYGFSLKDNEEIIWSDELAQFSNYVDSDWSRD